MQRKLLPYACAELAGAGGSAEVSAEGAGPQQRPAETGWDARPGQVPEAACARNAGGPRDTRDTRDAGVVRDADDTPDVREAARARVERLLDARAAAGWLSDARAAESLVATKASRFGSARLRRMLVERGVEREAADAALEHARATDFQRAVEVWRRRFGEPAPDAQGRARQQRFLLSRGFSAAVVRRVTGGDAGVEDGFEEI